MVKVDSYEEHGQGGPLHSFINLIGSSRNVDTSGNMFMLKTLVVSSTSSAIFGLVGGMLAPAFLGPAFGFLAGSGIGFVGGLCHRWSTDVREAKLAIAEAPKLMEYHINTHLLHVINKKYDELQPVEEFMRDVDRNIMKQGAIIAAVYAASESLSQIRQGKEKKLCEMYCNESEE